MATLKEMLRRNDMKVSGTKSELMDRIADCKMYGVQPRCPECGTGRLRVTYSTQWGHKGQGAWKCPGYFDDDTFVRCGFKSDETLERPDWTDR